MISFKRIIALLATLSMFFAFSSQQVGFVNADASSDKLEVQDLRTTNSKTYQLCDGSFECVVYSEDIHYIDENGQLADIDCSIVEDKENAEYTYTNSANSWNVWFADHLTSDNAILINKSDYSLSYHFLEGNSMASVQRSQILSDEKSEYYTEISKDDRAVVYQDILDSVDIVYSVRTNSIKEDIILKERIDQNSFCFALDMKNVFVFQEGNEIVFRESSGNEIFRMAKLYMIDANGKYSEAVNYELSFENETAVVKIVASEEFLQAEDTVYPVVIDPSTTVTGSQTKDTCVDEQYPTSNYYTSQNLWTGGKSGINTMRTYIKFDIPATVTSCITRATLKVKKNAYAAPGIKAYRVTSDWTPSAVTWNNKPGYTTSGASGTCSLYSGDWYQMEVTSIVYGWKHAYSNYGFLLKEPSENNAEQKTRWYSSDAPSPNKPELVIRYVNAYGTRSYQSVNSTGINCMGYAVEYNQFIGMSSLDISESAMNGMTKNQMLNYIAGKSETWMSDHLGSGGYSSLSTYDSPINTSSPGWFRVALRVGFTDSNNNGVFDVGELWDYHWRFQTNQYQTSASYGTWADKPGSTPSRYLTGTNGLDPAASPWISDYIVYDSACRYYQIKDTRSIS